MTLLTIVQSACDRLSLPRTTVVATATDQTVRNLLALAQEEGQELAAFGPWQVLRKEHTFSTVAAELQVSSLPTDLGAFVNDTCWNRTKTRPMAGPVSPQDWQRLKALTSSPVVDTFTIRGNAFRIIPTPAASETIAYEYVSSQWCESAGGADQSAWAADTDTGILSERLMSLGLIWRYKKSRGMSWDIDYAQYEYERNQALAQDSLKPVLDMAGGGGWRPGPPGITTPEGSWFA